MISNTQPAARSPQRPQFNRPFNERPRVQDEVLDKRTIETPRKRFTITRRKNGAGEFVRIVEERGGVFNTIIIPDDSAKEVLEHLQSLVAELGQPASDGINGRPDGWNGDGM